MQQLMFIEAGRLEWREAPAPFLQDSRDALVRPIQVASCDIDPWIVRGLTPFKGPFVLGHEFVAQIVELGDEVRNREVGERVVVPHHITCGRCERCRRGLTANCSAAPPLATYGLGNRGGDWGGALSDLVRVPFADYMLVPAPPGVDLQDLASVSENVATAWSAVAPYLEQTPGAAVLIIGGGGGGSIGLYAAAIAKALGAGIVRYVDTHVERLEKAWSLGATVIEGPPPARLDLHSITVNCSDDIAGLACAIRSTEPGGICTCTCLFFEEKPLPLLEMYNGSIRFSMGRPNARTHIPDVLQSIAARRWRPRDIIFNTARWDEAVPALLDSTTKLVITREEANA